MPGYRANTLDKAFFQKKDLTLYVTETLAPPKPLFVLNAIIRIKMHERFKVSSVNLIYYSVDFQVGDLTQKDILNSIC